MSLITQIQQSQIPLIMGILNVTPDSFSDGGQFTRIDKALIQVEKMLNEGADIIDVGGESTRPGACIVSIEEERQRVVPVIQAIKREFDVWVSVDTSKPDVMQQSVDVGADLINDVRALTEPNALETAVKCQKPVCLMHMQGQPQNMQDNPQYSLVVNDVTQYLAERAQVCIEAGIDRQQILIDPGFGFGKTAQDNFKLLNQLNSLTELGYPILAGLSRKRMIGEATGQDVEKRIYGSAAGALICAQKGAKIIRVHDVEATRDVLAVWHHTQINKN
ncbi:dihydropteroate synthase [Saccharobesus litoralis]|uniref:Dihydropteroate synthase n=1 Tax=Saccharobesus litoralis TaxID=2172099 RepID=A0A2S0VS84_9ALTE|nr:dihydropteroate synthase [Saccharobesus litoralis]AWB67078.1 dihydropteroate synthase [Saccharobesus litoralis]